ncbi:ABC-three component system protein [Elizabethkingia anophelis]|uniref:ABC-three component system protein n=1 Tax=Elizabethkingia anophelis TaxID=1117645 RepID=UPI002011F4D9|nr:ABC-three component system protein [Elizabethkingia anophelis]MCL1690467.1 HNH endonuclease [Elizabethkingia anophelis]
MSNPRTTASENQKLLLFTEVNGVCPLCYKELMYEKNNKKHKKFEIAHIYPLNPKSDELIILNNVNKLSTDPNSINNLICLCNECHTKFDNPRTLEEYQKLCSIKEELIKFSKERTLWENSCIERELNELIAFLADNDLEFNTQDILTYNPKTIDEKVNTSITSLVKRKIHRNVQDYYNSVNLKFIEIDNIKPTTTETISTQIKMHYLRIKKEIPDYDQKQIYEAMVNWLHKVSNTKSRETSEIIISYFIQTCEIF